MKTKTIKARLGPPLPTVLRELADKLIADDWVRHSTADDSSVYYLVGVKAHTADQEGQVEHLSLSVPLGGKVTVVGERQVHAQVASPKPGDFYLRRARQQLESTGIEPSEINAFLDLFERGEDFSPVVAPWHINQPVRFDAFVNVLHALALRRGATVDDLATESERRGAIDAAIEKVYLDEISRLFESLVSRARPLEQLRFEDAQLNEASRCFLYGFFRGAVVLCASALETNLRAAVGPSGVARVDERTSISNGRRRGFFNCLVDDADSKAVLGPRTRPGEEPPLVGYSRSIFSERTKVVHKGVVPTKDLAEELLMKARQVIEYIREHRTNPPRHEA
jgi:hypothetical protein